MIWGKPELETRILTLVLPLYLESEEVKKLRSKTPEKGTGCAEGFIRWISLHTMFESYLLWLVAAPLFLA